MGVLLNHLRRIYEWLGQQRRRLATAGVCLVAVWVLAHVVFGSNGMLVYQHKRAEYREVQKQTEEIQKENEALTRNIKALKNDRDAIEKEAREQLHYAKPGEVIYLMPGQKSAENPPANAAAKQGN